MPRVRRVKLARLGAQSLFCVVWLAKLCVVPAEELHCGLTSRLRSDSAEQWYGRATLIISMFVSIVASGNKSAMTLQIRKYYNTER